MCASFTDQTTVNPEIFANGVKRHICDIQNLRLVHDLPISANDRMISSFPEDFYFHETLLMRSFAEIKPSLKYPIYSI